MFEKFAANRFLLNPPFSYTDFGLPFFEFGLDNMEKGGLGAVIIQDSAGSGKATATTRRILSKHTMIASIKMPSDLFIPNAIVQTSIYVFEAKRPHNFELDIVKFIDFRNDGYKRTERGIKEIDSPLERYEDIFLLYKLGFNAVNNHSFHKDIWNINKVYCEDIISPEGNDWNFEKHIKHDTEPEIVNYENALKESLSWDIKQLILNQILDNISDVKPYKFKHIEASEVFVIRTASPSYDKGDLEPIYDKEVSYDYITRTSENRGICATTAFISNEGLQEAETFSLGLMQMIFYYREKEWYAGQFVKTIQCIDSNIDKYAKLYLETVLNGLTSKLLSVLVRDVEETFLRSKLLLPIKRNGKIDYEWMSQFIQRRRTILVDSVKKMI